MLTQLTINNFAIVRRLNLELTDGMSVITGETGAGKSIAIDALGLCLGQRTDSSMLRDGQERADISATFHLKSMSSAYNWLNENELQDSDNPEECILRRIINADGRSKAFINGIPVSITQLKEFSQYLIHINGQHASQLLLKTEHQLTILDNFWDNQGLLNTVSQHYRQWKDLQYQVKTFKQKCAEAEARKQLLKYQVDELDEFDLQENEYLELEEEHKRLSNSEELTSLTQSTLQLLSENEAVSIDSMLYHATQYLEELCELDIRYENVQNMLQEALIQVQEASNEMQHLASEVEQDPDLLKEIDDRVSKAIQLARKHYVEPEKLTELHQQLTQELHSLEDFAESENELIKQEQEAYQRLLLSAQQLTEIRQQGAKKLAQQVTQSIKQLAMENAEFSIQINSDYHKIAANGADDVTFMIQSNLGQVMQPLAKIASGGELSRIALAIQVLTSDQSAIPTLIFDEIDVGISGATASIVGKLLRQLGKKCQVICVTHLPQVASQGHQHFTVEKFVQNGATETQMKLLDTPQRIKELARLLGGSKITPHALANAEEMLVLAS